MKNWFWLFISPTIFFYKLLNKKPAEQEAPKGLESPSIEVGVNIPVLFGSRMIESPSIAWWGDVEIIKVPVPGKGKKG